MTTRQTSIFAVTRNGSQLAARLAPILHANAYVPMQFAPELPDVLGYYGSVLTAIHTYWPATDTLILIMASGIAIRAIAPLLGHKAVDPAVVCVDEAGRFIVPLIGGHQAGANALARRIAAYTGGHAVITTASDTQGLPALDRLANEQGWRVDADSALTHTMACLVNGEALACYVDPELPEVRADLAAQLAHCPDLTFVAQPEELLEPRYAAALLVSHRSLPSLWTALRAKTVRYTLPLLVVGIGCRRGVPVQELHSAITTTIHDAGLDPACIAALATAELKADEPGLLVLADLLGVPLEVVPTAKLTVLDAAGFSPSAATARFDVPGVAEPCAVLVAGGPLLTPKRSFARCTVALALCPHGARSTAPRERLHRTDAEGSPTPDVWAGSAPAAGRLTLIGIGPGDLAQLTLAARAGLQTAEIVTGYRVYIDLIRPLLRADQEVLVTPAMGDEIGRAQQAINLARSGRRVALISSGDIGIYAMAGPIFEQLRAANWNGSDPPVEVLPGISAFQALAARLGAPISHDVCLISLSDLLTPWSLIEQRIAAAAAADFIVAFYNPRSRERHWQLDAALALLRAQRPPTTPVALGRNVMRADEQITLTTLADLDPATVDMFTLVLVGNRQSYIIGGQMATPRGYAQMTNARLPEGATALGGVSSPIRDTPPYDYPIVLTNLAAGVAVVVGGGLVGERKTRGLLAAGATVHLISPAATPRLRAWAEAECIAWQQRTYRPTDLIGAQLAFAATDCRTINAQIALDAASLGVLCNVADAPDEGQFHVPALHRAHGFTIAVSSRGTAPARAVTLRDTIARWLTTNVPKQDYER
jgi:cobalt-precorrin 5A hydrolase/precorrin-3B C17-methyltransferase